jgi:hypothetical protein
MDYRILDITKQLGVPKKCWYMMSVVEAIAHAGGKTSDELLNELEGRAPNEKVNRVKTIDGRITTIDDDSNEGIVNSIKTEHHRFKLRKNK